MGRKERREFNKKHKTNLSSSEFTALQVWMNLQGGRLDVKSAEDLKLGNPYIHIDNEELVPNGTPCKLNYEHIKSRPKKDMTQKYLDWVELNKDKIFHVDRENSDTRTGLVGVAEKEDGNTWLFDTFSDLLYEKNGVWTTLDIFSEENNFQKDV